MAQTVKDVMTANPCTVSAGTTVQEAAELMRDKNIGPVLVEDGGKVCGIVTDRDIAVRAVAEGRDPRKTKVGEITSEQLVTVEPGTDAKQAAKLMEEHAVRRLPVVDKGRPVGIVSIGDLAVERDSDSVLAGISASPPNR